MNMKMDKHETQYKPQVYHGRRRGQNRIRYTKTIINPGIGHTVEIEILPTEAEETLTEIIDQIIEVDQEIIIDRMIDEIITGEMIGEIISGVMIGETITDKIIEGTTM